MRADRAMGERASNTRIDVAAPPPRSVRRVAAPPRHRVDLNSGPIRHPGAVPFVWEKRPGQPKSVRTRRAPPLTPPRETSLTRAEDVAGSPYHDALEEFGPVLALRGVGTGGFRTGAAAAPRKQEEEEEDEVVAEEAKVEVNRQEAVVAPAVVPRKQDDGGGGEEDEERFSDALDTLSRSESLAMNCSVSGLSGVPGATASPEPGARGVMMDRFLPAAHAVAVGSPQYTFRKAGATGNSGREHARAKASGTGNGDDRSRRAPVQLPHQHLPPNYLSCTYPRREEHDEEEDDDDDDDDDYDVHNNRGCGLLPGLCVKTSMLLLNPMPAIKRGKAQGRGRGRQFPSKGPSPLARCSQNKPIGCDSKRQSWEDVYKHKLEQKYLGQGEDGRSKLTSESNQLTFWSDSQTGDGSSPFHHSITGGTSPYHSYAAMSPSSKANESFRTEDRNERSGGSNGSGSLGRDHDRSSGSDHSSFKGSSSMSSGLDTTGHEDSMDHRGDIDPEICHLGLLLDTKVTLNAKVNDSQPQGQQIVRRNSSVKKQDDGLLNEKISETSESTIFMLCGNSVMEKLDDGKHLGENGVGEKENMALQSLLPLPVPKSPSESWLSRTLPSVANKPPMPSFLGIQVQAKKQAPWASTHPKENDQKSSRKRIIRFADVVERPTSLKSEM